MRRAIMTIGGTFAAVAALLSFKSHSAAGVSAAAMPATSAMSGTASSSGATTTPTAGTAPSSGGKSGPKSAAGRTVTGKVASTPDGPTQVQLVVAGRRITAVNVLQHTDNGENSLQIDSFALPKLTSEALTAQSARINAVSGATYTSAGYIQSLQSAVDAAHL
jgi:uncharacterized protein with FMN-binding domain